MSAPVKAENPAYVRQLLETGECAGVIWQRNLAGAHLMPFEGCQFKDANLTAANLEGADLAGANLSKIWRKSLRDMLAKWYQPTGVNFSGAKLYSAEMQVLL